jgi:hypothetical protein
MGREPISGAPEIGGPEMTSVQPQRGAASARLGTPLR